MSHFHQEYKIAARDYDRGGENSIEVQRVLKAVGYAQDILRRAAVCAYEAEMNVVIHGGDGSMELLVAEDRITIEVRDAGPGISDVDAALREGFSTASQEARAMGFGAGMGLSNIKKNADTFEIQSAPGAGTYLKMCFNTEARKRPGG